MRSFDNIVREICSTMGDADNTGYARVARVLKTVLNQLNFHVLTTGVKSQKFTLGSNMTIDLPNEAELVTKVGVPNAEKGIIPLRRRKNRADAHEDCPCDAPAETPVTFFNYCYTGEPYTWDLYGIYQDFHPGSWWHDIEAARVEIGGLEVNDKVVVEYKLVSGGDNIVVPEAATLMVVNRTLEQLTRYKDPRLAEVYRQQFLIEYNEYKRLYEDFDLDTFINEIRSSARGAAKF